MIVHPPSRSPWRMLFTLKGSIVPVIWKRVLAMMMLAAGVVLLAHDLPHTSLALSAAPLTLIGLTLAIFLGFRNSIAYERWWEARTMWGELLNVVRNLARQTQTLLSDAPPLERRVLVHRLVGFAHALRHLLRGTDPAADLVAWLPAEEAAALTSSPNPANAVLGIIGKHYAEQHRAGRLDSILLASIDAQITRMSYVLGGCERIRSTPIPFAYILLLHRTVYMYCLLLPFCLVDSVGWLTPLMVGILSYTFFGLDALGEQIEDPFDRLPNDLALDTICRGIEISLADLLGDSELQAPLSATDGVLL